MAELIELTCPNCGAKLEKVGDAAQAQCPHCGTQLLIDRKAIALTTAEPTSCPKCGKGDWVRKVAAVHHAGLSSGSYSGHVWTDKGFDSVSLTGRTQTVTSRLLSPPKEPSSVTWLGRILTGWGWFYTLSVGVGGLCVVAAFLTAVAEGDFAQYTIPGLASKLVYWSPLLVCVLAEVFLCGVVPLLFGNRIRRSKRRQYPIEKEKWERAIGRWERLYYCARDDGVFVPGETPFIPIDNVQEFLYAE